MRPLLRFLRSRRSITPAAVLAVLAPSCNASPNVREPFRDGAPRELDAGADVATTLGPDGAMSLVPPPLTPPPNWPRVQPPRCARDNEAPVPDGRGGVACTRAGASDAVSASWPEVAGARAPLVYVREGSEDGAGCGAMARPCGSIAAGVRELGAEGTGTVLVAPGRYPVAAPVRLARAVSVIGAGAQATVVAVDVDAPAFIVEGSSANATLARLAIAASAGRGMAASVDVRGAATATLRDVAVGAGVRGVDVDGAFLRVDGLTARGASRFAIALRSGSDGSLKGVLARDTAGPAVFARASRVTLTESLLAGGRGPGVWLAGEVAAGAADRIDRTAAVESEGAGVLVDGARRVDLTLVTLAGARRESIGGGDGLFARNGAAVRFDPAIASDALRGFGSAVIGNARAGVVATGARTTLAANGVRVAANPGIGVLVQSEARVSLGYAELTDNLGAGMAVASGGSIVSLLCNLFDANRAGGAPGAIPSLTWGDGLVFASTRSAQALIVGNAFTSNARFGALFVGVNAELMQNMAHGNRFQIGVYETTEVMLDQAARASVGASSLAPGDVALPDTSAAVGGIALGEP